MSSKKKYLWLGTWLAVLLLVWLALRPAPKPLAVATVGLKPATQATGLPKLEERMVVTEGIAKLDTAIIVDTQLTPEERAAPLPFQVALKMRNLDELRARIYKGEIISQKEMAEKYYPTPEHFQQVADWLGGTGLQIQPADITRLSVVATGSVAEVASALQTDFVRVMGRDGLEYTSASTAPSLPKAWSPFLLSVSGLQPQLQARVSRRSVVALAEADAVAALVNGSTLTPQAVLQAYGASGLGLDGTLRGQIKRHLERLCFHYSSPSISRMLAITCSPLTR